MALLRTVADLAERQELLRQQGRKFVGRAAAENTKRAYEADWEHFTSWCASLGYQALPASPETVADYLTDMAVNGYEKAGERQPYSVATMERHLATISRVHQLKGLEFFTKKEPLYSTFKGIKNELGRGQKQKAPILVEQLRQMVALAPSGKKGLRDRALLLLWFAAAGRRTEAVAVLVEHLTFTAEGLRLYIPKSKTDQEGEGYTLPIFTGRDPSTCPVQAVRRWLEVSGITEGPVIPLCDRQAARIVKKYAQAIGMNPTDVGGHSMRAGWITQAAKNKEPAYKIMDHSRHKSEHVMRRYIRNATIFEDSPAGRIGL